MSIDRHKVLITAAISSLRFFFAAGRSVSLGVILYLVFTVIVEHNISTKDSLPTITIPSPRRVEVLHLDFNYRTSSSSSSSSLSLVLPYHCHLHSDSIPGFEQLF